MKNGFECEKNIQTRKHEYLKNQNRLKGAIECYAIRKMVEKLSYGRVSK